VYTTQHINEVRFTVSDSFVASEFDMIRSADPDKKGLIECAVIPLQGGVIFPHVVTPVTVGAGSGLEAAQHAISRQQTAIALTRKNPDAQTPTIDDLFSIGTEIALGHLIPFPEHRKTVLTQGRRRVEVVSVTQTEPFLKVKARVLKEEMVEDDETQLLAQTVMNLFQSVVDMNEMIAEDVLDYALTIDDPSWLSDFVSSALTLNLEDRQRLLETLNVNTRLRDVAKLLRREMSMLELRDEIDGQIQQEMNRTQREIYLREQMRVIQSELGEDDIFQQEINDVRQQVENAGLPKDILDRAMKELSRMAMMQPMSPEMGIIRTYIDWLVSLPWTNKTEDNLDPVNAQTILDAEHYGLPKVKDRIMEYIAVRKLAADRMKTPILCFVGPPGVGKTSLGRSIAKALGREFVRVSLGGIRDEAEIRGHRRTYIGALPGRILQTMRRAGTVNPVFMLDEIDKIGADFRGDPSAALLEVLDPEQNFEFSDHYLDLPYDLSNVLFITTANDLYPLPEALLDRLEVIEFPGYSEEEKIAIAEQFLLPEQIESHGLTPYNPKFEIPAIQTIIREYTYEAGVRNLNREIASVCRKIARLVAQEKKAPKRITPKQVAEFLGPPQYLEMRANQEDSVGLATGLAWTWGGGDVLTIEVSLLPGKGNLLLTGQLGEVMQESAQAALSYMRAQANELGVPSDDFENYDVHIHIPEGATPKEGPSAGITLAAAIVSAFTERRVRAEYAMTGEITLRGRVLPVGGIKEKVLAAHRAKIRQIILPALNKKDVRDISAKTLRELNIHFVENMQEVISLVLLEPPAGGRQRDRDRDLKNSKKKDTAPKKGKKGKKDKDKSRDKAPQPAAGDSPATATSEIPLVDLPESNGASSD
jgi:ATP-dependent Lon protease